MAKLVLNDVTNLENQSSAVTTINNNSAAIETAFENTLSRDGTSPNEMGATLDMNSNRIINLPAATTGTEPVRLAEFSVVADAVEDINEAAQAAEEHANAAAASATLASDFATTAAEAAAEAESQADKFRSSSTTENTIGLGTQTFTVDQEDYFSVNGQVFIQDGDNDANFMYGTVTSYLDDALEVDVFEVGGAGTISNWLITVNGPRGATGPIGPTGPQGDVSGPTGSTTGNIATFEGDGGNVLEDSGINIDDVVTFSDADTEYLTTGTAASTYLTIAGATAAYQPLDSDLTSWAGVTRGTGFDTATAVNVGTSGSFVVMNGALGTPSTGTLTNATGLPAAGVVNTALVTSVEGQGPITGGAPITPKNLGTPSTSSTVTLDVGDCQMQYLTNDDNFTLTTTTDLGACALMVINAAATPGTITTSAFDKVIGSFSATVNQRHRCLVEVWPGPYRVLEIVRF